jgi:hypothetical protein
MPVIGPGLPAISVELLPRPRLIVWHGEPGDDPATGNALGVIHRTYRGVIGHGIVPGGRTAGGNDWSGWHFPDSEAIGGLAELATAIAPPHWTIVTDLDRFTLRHIPPVGNSV